MCTTCILRRMWTSLAYTFWHLRNSPFSVTTNPGRHDVDKRLIYLAFQYFKLHQVWCRLFQRRVGWMTFHRRVGWRTFQRGFGWRTFQRRVGWRTFQRRRVKLNIYKLVTASNSIQSYLSSPPPQRVCRGYNRHQVSPP